MFADILKRLKRRKGVALEELRLIWDEVSRASSRRKPPQRLFVELARRVLRFGEPLLAFDITRRGLDSMPGDPQLRQLAALALAQSGAAQDANRMMLDLYSEGHHDSETLGILARTHKDLWQTTLEKRESADHLRQAYRCYRKGYASATQRRDDDGAIYAGINAATMALLSGRKSLARRLAREVRDLCIGRLSRGEDYWAHASLGEAAIVLERASEAEDHYARAGEIGRKNHRELASTREQARLLQRHLRLDPSAYDRCFIIPTILVFTGHMVDRPDRPRPRLPPALLAPVRKEIRRFLKGHDEKIAYAGAACGSDILFLEEMKRQGAEYRVVLPYPKERFLEASVDLQPGSDWPRRFRRVLASAASVLVTSESRQTENLLSYEYANLVQIGLAQLRAQSLFTEVAALAVWNGEEGEGPEGTASLIQRWQQYGLPVEIINPSRLGRTAGTFRGVASIRKAKRRRGSAGDTGRSRAFKEVIVTLLFADVVGYSKLTEEEIPPFIEHFMGAVSRLITDPASRPLIKNTWGDALYFVFDKAGQAGRTALNIRDLIANTDWAAHGLPEGLTMRIGLHAGPAYTFYDPVLKRKNYSGSHVSRAARIEPITPPGQVYASQAFAALATVEQAKGFCCNYVGETPLAKRYGSFPVYHVRRSSR